MILKRDMTAAESNYLQCSIMIFIAGILIAVVSDWDMMGYGSALLGVVFFLGFLHLKKEADKETIAKATKTVRKDQPKDGYKVKYTTKKERRAAKEAEEAKNKKNFPANKSNTVKKNSTLDK